MGRPSDAPALQAHVPQRKTGAASGRRPRGPSGAHLRRWRVRAHRVARRAGASAEGGSPVAVKAHIHSSRATAAGDPEAAPAAGVGVGAQR
ncbi:hypothetical protein [Streptomyces chryseus]